MSENKTYNICVALRKYTSLVKEEYRYQILFWKLFS